MGHDRSHSRSGRRGRDAAAPLTLRKHRQWHDAAEQGLALALGDYAQDIRDAVDVGRMELFEVDGRSWMVTEVAGDALIVWCYQGAEVRRAANAMVKVAAKNGLEVLEYSTRKPALARLLRSMGFELVSVDDGDIERYQVTVQ